MQITTCSESTPKLTASGLPKGLKFVDERNGSGTISGTPTSSGLITATVGALVENSPAAAGEIAFTVDNKPVFKSKNSYLSHTGTALSYPIITAEGYPPPAITTASALPAGVALVDNGNGTAALTGTPRPESGGVFAIALTATNGIGTPVNQSFKLAVYQAPAITSPSSDTVTTGVEMGPFDVTDTAYPVAKLVAHGLPQGVTLSAGAIKDEPITAGSYPVTITASGKAGSSSQAFTLTVNS